MHPGNNWGQQHPGLYRSTASKLREWIIPVLSALIGVLHAVTASKHIDKLEQVSWRATRMVKVWTTYLRDGEGA